MVRHLLVAAVTLWGLATPASADRVTYAVSGAIEQINPGIADGAGLPSSFEVGDPFSYTVSIDTTQPITLLWSDLYSSVWTAEADLFLEVGGVSFDALAESIYVTEECRFVDPSRCDLYVERVSGSPLPFDGDSLLQDVQFSATLSPADYTTPGWLGDPLVPNGSPSSFALQTCVPGSCLVDYTALGTVDSVEIYESVPAVGPTGAACLVALIGLTARRASKGRPTTGRDPLRARRRVARRRSYSRKRAVCS